MLGERLAKLRKQRNLTQQQVANKVHISRATYAQYEIDRRVPEYLTLEKLADFFGKSIDYLVGREVKEGVTTEMLNEADQQFMDEFMKLDEDEKEKFKNIIKAIRGVKLS